MTRCGRAAVQVVILNWNGSGHLRRFLPSVLRDVPDGAEVVVADNGSDDDSLQVLREEFPQAGIVAFDANYGFAGGYNRALRQSDADYVVLLNSDVETSPGWLEPLVAALDADERLFAVQPKIKSLVARGSFEYAGACGGFIDSFGYPFCRGRMFDTVEPDCGQYDTFTECFWASGACMACRRDVFLDLGGFDEAFFAHMEEIDLCWRARLAGWRVAVEPASTVYHLGGGTLSSDSPRKVFLNFRNNLLMLHKNLSRKRRRVILCRLLLDGVAAAMFLLRGRGDYFRAVVAAHRAFFEMRREYIPYAGKTSEAGAACIFPGSVVMRYYLLRQRRFSRLRGSSNAAWRCGRH